MIFFIFGQSGLIQFSPVVLLWLHSAKIEVNPALQIRCLNSVVTQLLFFPIKWALLNNLGINVKYFLLVFFT